jgi:AcrR family transcriptional regulator
MAERGYAATTIGAICAATGLAPTAIYWHFGSKDGLLAAVIERSIDQWYAELVAAMGAGTELDSEVDPGALLADYDRFARVFVDSYRATPEALRLLLWLGLDQRQPQGEVRLAIQAARRRAVALIAGQLARLIPGEGGLPDKRHERVARALLVLLDGIFVAHQIDDDADRLDDQFSMARTAILAVGAEHLLTSTTPAVSPPHRRARGATDTTAAAATPTTPARRRPRRQSRPQQGAK